MSAKVWPSRFCSLNTVVTNVKANTVAKIVLEGSALAYLRNRLKPPPVSIWLL